MFHKIIFPAKLDDLWQLQLEDYDKEEQTLRVMMEKDKVVRQEKQIPSGLEVNLDKWQIALFGNHKSLDYEHLVHTAADHDVHSLIQTRYAFKIQFLLFWKIMQLKIFCSRQCWDQFVVSRNPLSSQIPVGWVLPCKPSSDEWKALLTSNQ